MNREDFPILKSGIIYFDNGATTLKPKCVVDEMVNYYTKYTSNIHRGDYDNAMKTNDLYDKVSTYLSDYGYSSSGMGHCYDGNSQQWTFYINRE